MADSMLFGVNAFWFATTLFVVGYLYIMSERVNRAIVALLGAGLMIISGVLTQEKAIASIDFNTLGLLAGMMVIVHITGKTGVFQFLAIWATKKVKASPWLVMLMISVMTALMSALLDNVTTVMLVVPVLLHICKELRVPVYPYLLSCIFASNIGGTATYIGDPPNIMIGSAAAFTFNDFLLHTLPVAVVVLIITMIPFYIFWGRRLFASAEDRARVMAMDECGAIHDKDLLRDCLLVCALVVGAFTVAHHVHIEPATIAMTGAALLLFLENLRHDRDQHAINVHAAFAEAEWVTLFFFIGLFVMVAGIEHVGLIEMMGRELLRVTHGDAAMTSYAILWTSAIASAFLDNIPFTATMIPMIKSLAPTLGGDAALHPLWWSLSLGACFGGNGTLIGASANLVVAGCAERAGFHIRFMTYLKHAFPLMIMSILISHLYIWLLYYS